MNAHVEEAGAGAGAGERGTTARREALRVKPSSKNQTPNCRNVDRFTPNPIPNRRIRSTSGNPPTPTPPHPPNQSPLPCNLSLPSPLSPYPHPSPSRLRHAHFLVAVTATITAESRPRRPSWVSGGEGDASRYPLSQPSPSLPRPPIRPPARRPTGLLHARPRVGRSCLLFGRGDHGARWGVCGTV